MLCERDGLGKKENAEDLQFDKLWAERIPVSEPCFQIDACPCKIRETSSKEYLWAYKLFTLCRELLVLPSPFKMQYDSLTVAIVLRSLTGKAAVAKSFAWITLLDFTTFYLLWKAQFWIDLLLLLHGAKRKTWSKEQPHSDTQQVEQDGVADHQQEFIWYWLSSRSSIWWVQLTHA